jgi:hypothetical protein
MRMLGHGSLIGRKFNNLRRVRGKTQRQNEAGFALGYFGRGVTMIFKIKQ